ncbi:MAG: diguanylate cyclase, partial [Acidobacteriota bacterium]|nr:diguanylate cyclase [Acidobacteriota bacterium]
MRDRTRDDGRADLLAELSDMGLSQKAAWYSSAVLYGGGGLLVSALATASSHLFPSGLSYLGYVALAMGVLCLVAARRQQASPRLVEAATHARLLIGLAIWVAGIVVLGRSAIAFALLPLFSVLNPCYLYPVRIAVRYVIVTTAIVCAMVIASADTDAIGHALMAGLVIVGISAALIITKERTLELARRNRRLAYTDPLTGIANMRALRERIGGEPASAQEPFALFALDLDNFKEVNDRFDHALGDRVLCAVAGALSGELQEGDLAVRRGGDEFVVHAPSPGARDLEDLRRRIEHAVREVRRAICPGVRPSVGVAYIRTRPGEELGATLERADDALHEVKAAVRRERGAGRHLATGPRGSGSPAVADGPRHGRPVIAAVAALAAGDANDRAGARTERSPQAAPERTAALGLRSALGRVQPDWGFMALAVAVAGCGLLGIAAAGLAAPLDRPTGIAFASGMLALSAASLAAGLRNAPRIAMRVAWLAVLGLVAATILASGRGGAAVLDLLAGLAVFGMLVFRGRTAVANVVLAMVLYIAIAAARGFPYALARIVVAVVVVTIVGSLVGRLRTVTARFARRNRELSEVDALTGLANVRALHDRVADAIERSDQEHARPIVVSIDLDDFKSVNDNFS